MVILYSIHGLEFNGQISFLKAGLYYADHITAVSPTLRSRDHRTAVLPTVWKVCCNSVTVKGARLSGVLNGVDEKIWVRETDLLLASR